MVYNILITNAAKNQLAKLDKQTAKRITKKLHEITENPFLHVTKLVGLEIYKLRIGDYRVLLNIQKNNLIIIIIEIGHRRNVYNNY